MQQAVWKGDEIERVLLVIIPNGNWSYRRFFCVSGEVIIRIADSRCSLLFAMSMITHSSQNRSTTIHRFSQILSVSGEDIFPYENGANMSAVRMIQGLKMQMLGLNPGSWLTNNLMNKGRQSPFISLRSKQLFISLFKIFLVYLIRVG